ncbi:MAG: tetraacyldisaccharide 4'-kinase [Candidatus Ratteibacteria bacterium]|nr:tetraacyldisaccharide 4'-kinase [Candidatus Ratteibacteria bacterium]
MKIRNNAINIIEKGGNFYWYFWHLGNEGPKGVLDAVFLFMLKCLIPVYYFGVFMKRFLRPQNIVGGFPVISVGNLTMGGTGKTPCVELIVRKLLDKKLRVGLLTGGYARTSKDNKKIVSYSVGENSEVKDIGDEPYLFSKHFPSIPIFISRNRAKSLSEATQKRQCDIFIMDDGFQYHNIEKDLEILLVNKRNPFGNGSLFPAGFLREPVSSVKRADLIIFTHCGESIENSGFKKSFSALLKQPSKIPVLESVHKPLHFEKFDMGVKYRTEEIANRRFLSLCSLADPLSFEKSLEKLNFEPIKKLRFPDHYIYKIKDIEWLNTIVEKENIDFVATTEKDWVRLPKEIKISVPVLCLIMELKITRSEEILDNMINKVLDKYKNEI